jgi:hypothetical protein
LFVGEEGGEWVRKVRNGLAVTSGEEKHVGRTPPERDYDPSDSAASIASR